MKILVMIILFLTTSCGLTTSRPKIEMSLAQAAFIAAKEAKADLHAPELYRRAEINYLKAKSAYKRKYFNKAKAYAEASKQFSEQAEFQALKIQTFEN